MFYLRLFCCIDLGTRPGYPHGSFSRKCKLHGSGETELIERWGCEGWRCDTYWWLRFNSELPSASAIRFIRTESKTVPLPGHGHPVSLCLSRPYAVYSTEVTLWTFSYKNPIVATYTNAMSTRVVALTLPWTTWHETSHSVSLGLSLCSIRCEIKILLLPQVSLNCGEAKWDHCGKWKFCC